MSTYYLTAEALPATRRLLLRRLLLTGLVLGAGGFCYSYFVLHSGPYISLALSVILVVALGLGYRRNLEQQRVALDSYRLEVGPDFVARTQHGLPTLQLPAHEITSLTQHYQGVLTLATANKYRAIYVPPQITHRAELLAELARFGPLTVRPRPTLHERFGLLLTLLSMGVMGTFYFTDNRVLGVATGVLTLGILAWSGYHIWRNPNLPAQTRRLRWLLPLVFLAVLAGVVARLLH